MLVKNPITSYLYIHGYKGLESIYEYWFDHRDDIIESYKRLYIDKYSSEVIDETLNTFEHKIRWASNFGQFMRLGFARMLRINKDNVCDFGTLTVRFATRYHSLLDYNKTTYPNYIDTEATINSLKIDETMSYHDLRGVSILKKQFTDTTIKNVDFSYAALDANDFKNVNLINCRFYKTSFTQCRMNNCSFDDSCILDHNDFSCTYIHGDFDCIISSPIINSPKFRSAKKFRNFINKRFLKYSVIASDSFSDRCNNTEIQTYRKRIKISSEDM